MSHQATALTSLAWLGAVCVDKTNNPVVNGSHAEHLAGVYIANGITELPIVAVEGARASDNRLAVDVGEEGGHIFFNFHASILSQRVGHWWSDP